MVLLDIFVRFCFASLASPCRGNCIRVSCCGVRVYELYPLYLGSR